MIFGFEHLYYVIGIYFIGFIISIYLFKHEIAEEAIDILGNKYLKTYMDVCLKSMCWPLLFIVLIVIGPFMLITKLICGK